MSNNLTSVRPAAIRTDRVAYRRAERNEEPEFLEVTGAVVAGSVIGTWSNGGEPRPELDGLPSALFGALHGEGTVASGVLVTAFGGLIHDPGFHPRFHLPHGGGDPWGGETAVLASLTVGPIAVVRSGAEESGEGSRTLTIDTVVAFPDDSPELDDLAYEAILGGLAALGGAVGELDAVTASAISGGVLSARTERMTGEHAAGIVGFPSDDDTGSWRGPRGPRERVDDLGVRALRLVATVALDGSGGVFTASPVEFG